jgi:hypothetical protein
MKKPGEHIRVNLGQSPFIFDIDGMMSVSYPDSSSGYVLSATSRESSVPLSIASSATQVEESGAGHEALGEVPHEYVVFPENRLQSLQGCLQELNSFHDELFRVSVIRRYDTVLKALSAKNIADNVEQQEKQYVRQQVEAIKCVLNPPQFCEAV